MFKGSRSEDMGIFGGQFFRLPRGLSDFSLTQSLKTNSDCFRFRFRSASFALNSISFTITAYTKHLGLHKKKIPFIFFSLQILRFRNAGRMQQDVLSPLRGIRGLCWGRLNDGDLESRGGCFCHVSGTWAGMNWTPCSAERVDQSIHVCLPRTAWDSHGPETELWKAASWESVWRAADSTGLYAWTGHSPPRLKGVGLSVGQVQSTWERMWDEGYYGGHLWKMQAATTLFLSFGLSVYNVCWVEGFFAFVFVCVQSSPMAHLPPLRWKTWEPSRLCVHNEQVLTHICLIKLETNIMCKQLLGQDLRLHWRNPKKMHCKCFHAQQLGS